MTGAQERETPYTPYEVDERGLFCKHCGRTTIRHYIVRGIGYVCRPVDTAGNEA